jgi:Family of unknown function (DUF5947)
MSSQTALSSPRLRRLASRPAPPIDAEPERCQLCAAPVGEEHRHLVSLQTREIMCACRPCSLLFDRDGAGGGQLRLIGDRRLKLEDFVLDETTWAALQIPVQIAFFFVNSVIGRVVALYPSPMGATESSLQLDAWQQVARRNPVLATMEPDVEALLVDRAKGKREHWILPVDRCYELVGLVRTHWKGFGGGDEVWKALETFFEQLRDRARRVTKEGEEATWEGSRSASRT